MKPAVLLISTLILFRISSECQSLKFKPSFSVALDTSYGPTLLTQCSRSIPENVNGFWAITSSDIQTIEDKLETVKNLTAKECCLINGKVDSLENYAFQYIGVTINGKRFVYVNAFPLAEIEHLNARDYDPAKYPHVVCDGGYYYWGVLFDMETKQFIFLAFNGGTYGG